MLKPILSRLLLTATEHLIGKVKRASGVHEAMELGKNRQNAAISTAVPDLKQAIGSAGELTNTMAAFLQDLETTGLIDQLAIAAITQIATPANVEAFTFLYERYFPRASRSKAPTAEQMYEKLRLMMRASMINEVNTAVFLGAETYKKLEDIGQQLEIAMRRPFPLVDRVRGQKSEAPEWYTIAPKIVRQVTSDLARAILPHFEKIRVEGPAKTSLEVNADLIYVASDVIPVDTVESAKSPARKQLTPRPLQRNSWRNSTRP